MTRPNVLLLFTDQQRFDTIHALNNPVIRTPNLDRIFQSGVAFDAAYSPCPVCVPARACMHYGQYPSTVGSYENSYAMPDDGRPSVMDGLKQAGYETHGIGKCHFIPDEKALRGFCSREVQEEIQPRNGDDYMQYLEEVGKGEVFDPNGARGEMYYMPQISQLPSANHPTNWVGDRSVRFVEERTDSKQPWCLFSSFIHPHPPFAPPSPWHKLYPAAAMPLPNVPQDAESLHVFINRQQNRYKYRDQGIDTNLLRCMKAYYYACISFVDFQIGRIYDALEKSGQLDNTLILFSSDHGEHLGDYNCFGKRSMHDSCMRIPMLARLPGRFEGGQVCSAPSSLVDIAPTIYAATGCDTSGMTLDGVDLHALMGDTPARDAVFAQYQQRENAIYSIMTERWKYAYSAADDQEYLFDRQLDPHETRNHAGVAIYAKSQNMMRNRLHEFLIEHGESDALENGAWKRYPVQNMPRNPDARLLNQDPPGMKLDLPGYSDHPCV